MDLVKIGVTDTAIEYFHQNVVGAQCSPFEGEWCEWGGRRSSGISDGFHFFVYCSCQLNVMAVKLKPLYSAFAGTSHAILLNLLQNCSKL
jgi:hypothetical protein